MSKLKFNKIEEMFEKLSIPEIKRALSHSQSSASTVQLELRGLVAARYPDLLKSAGTVLEMKVRSNEIHEILRTVPQMCDVIAKHKWGMPTATATATTKGQQNNNNVNLKQHQLSLSWTTYPEQIWAALDNRDCVRAAAVLIQECVSEDGSLQALSSTTISQRAQQRQLANQIKRQAKRTLGEYEHESNPSNPSNQNRIVGALSVLVLFGETQEEALSILLNRRLSFIQQCTREEMMGNGSRSSTATTTTTAAAAAAATTTTTNSTNSTNDNDTENTQVQQITQTMATTLHCVNATLLVVRDAFVEQHVVNTLTSILNTCNIPNIQDLLQITNTILFNKDNGTINEEKQQQHGSSFVTPSISKCSTSTSVWLKKIVNHMNNLQDTLLPSSMTAHQVAAVQQSLALNTCPYEISSFLLPTCDVSYTTTTTNTSITATTKKITALSLLYNNIFAKRGTLLLETALSKAMEKYIQGVRLGVQRIEAAGGNGANALGDSTSSAASATLSNVATSFGTRGRGRNSNAKHIRARSKIEQNWAINYAKGKYSKRRERASRIWKAL
jgi:hypothetical protein